MIESEAVACHWLSGTCMTHMVGFSYDKVAHAILPFSKGKKTVEKCLEILDTLCEQRLTLWTASTKGNICTGCIAAKDVCRPNPLSLATFCA
jgi:hypothetical protein